MTAETCTLESARGLEQGSRGARSGGQAVEVQDGGRPETPRFAPPSRVQNSEWFSHGKQGYELRPDSRVA